MNKNTITACLLAIISTSVSADYMLRAPLKKAYNFFPDTEHVRGDWVNIGEVGDCKGWLPQETAVSFGQLFEQERVCKQQRSRTVQIVHKNPDTGDSINGDLYTEYGSIDIGETQESIGKLIKFAVNIPGKLEYQNDKSISVTAEIHKAKSVQWESSPNLKISGSGKAVSVVANNEQDGWLRYQLTDSEGTLSGWSTKYPVDVINDYVDTRFLKGTKYTGQSRSINTSGVPTRNFTYESWVKPNKVLKDGSVSGNVGTDGVSGENYVFYPDHGYSDTSNGLGLSVGTNGIKVHAHTTNYMPALFVSYTPVSSSQWTHFAVSVSNDIATIYRNGNVIGKTVRSSHGAALVPKGIGTSSSYGAFHGYLAESRIWNKPLTAAEIKGLHQRHLTTHTLPSGARLVGVVK